MRKIAIVGTLTGALAACTLTTEQKAAIQTAAPIIVSLASELAPKQIVDQMRKGCSDLMSNQQLVDLAVAQTVRVLKDTQGYVTTASNAASIGCSLLVPAPVVAKSG